MTQRIKKQRWFKIDNHDISFKHVKNIKEHQFIAMNQAGPECITTQDNWVEMTVSCDNCHRQYEMTLQDDRREVSLVKRYMLGQFASTECINQKI